MIKGLINEYKCDRMARDEDGRTPLHCAAECGMEEIVRVLIVMYSCPVDCVDSNGLTPLMAASNMGQTSIVKMLASDP